MSPVCSVQNIIGFMDKSGSIRSFYKPNTAVHGKPTNLGDQEGTRISSFILDGI